MKRQAIAPIIRTPQTAEVTLNMAFTPGTITSPCVSICALDKDDVCIGCHRTAKEIRDWLLMNDDERLDVIVKAAERGRKNNPFA